MPGYAADPRVDLVAVCDMVPERAAAWPASLVRTASTLNRKSYCPTRKSRWWMSARRPTHIELGMAAIAAGKHVLCEKPIAVCAREAFMLARAAEQASEDKVGFTFRYSPALRQIRRLD